MWKIPKQGTRQTSHFLKNEETQKALQSLREPGTQGWNTIQSLSKQDRSEKIYLFKISKTLPVDIPEDILFLSKKWWPHQDLLEYLVELLIDYPGQFCSTRPVTWRRPIDLPGVTQRSLTCKLLCVSQKFESCTSCCSQEWHAKTLLIQFWIFFLNENLVPLSLGKR